MINKVIIVSALNEYILGLIITEKINYCLVFFCRHKINDFLDLYLFVCSQPILCLTPPPY